MRNLILASFGSMIMACIPAQASVIYSYSGSTFDLPGYAASYGHVTVTFSSSTLLAEGGHRLTDMDGWLISDGMHACGTGVEANVECAFVIYPFVSDRIVADATGAVVSWNVIAVAGDTGRFIGSSSDAIPFGMQSGQMAYDYGFIGPQQGTTTSGNWRIAVVPVPASAWLLGCAVGLIGLVRRAAALR